MDAGALVLVPVSEQGKEVNPDYGLEPIKVYVGNPPDPPDDECRWCDDGICHDKDHDCPDGSIICCDDCKDVDGCKYSCQVVNS